MNQNSGSVSDEPNNEECSKKDQNLRMNEFYMHQQDWLQLDRLVLPQCYFLKTYVPYQILSHNLWSDIPDSWNENFHSTKDLTSVHKSFNIV